MIFGYSTNAFVNYTLIEAIERIARLGFKGVEIMGDRPHLYPPDFDEKEVNLIKSVLDNHCMKVTNINSFTLFAVGDTYLPSWIEPVEARRAIRVQHTLDSLYMAHELGCKNISIPPGGPLNAMAVEGAKALFYDGLAQVIPTAEKLGVNLLIEPEPDLMIETSAQFLDFIAGVHSSAVGLNFDIGHFFCAGEDPAVAFNTLFKWVRHVHLEDIAASRAHHHLIPGVGAIDFTSVLREMMRLGYKGDISLELYTYKDDPDTAGRKSLDFLQPIFDELGINPNG
ncbi:MAG: sugar phosphate isomerase/epimerase family protein [Desulfobacterales bacterium]|jgi:sugar phosphate isomerase/epimerase|nr:sugar phosphate isomerase/epimerase family protein [Desulfobacterales bacterium]